MRLSIALLGPRDLGDCLFRLERPSARAAGLLRFSEHHSGSAQHDRRRKAGAAGVPTGSVHNARPCRRCRYRVSGRVACRFLTVAHRLTDAEQSRRRAEPHQRALEADCGAILKAMPRPSSRSRSARLCASVASVVVTSPLDGLGSLRGPFLSAPQRGFSSLPLSIRPEFTQTVI
jgi:hypothetical protein